MGGEGRGVEPVGLENTKEERKSGRPLEKGGGGGEGWAECDEGRREG